LAIYHLSVKPVSRGHGRSATAAAAYRAAERVQDHTSGEVFDYTRKRGVEHTEIVMPTTAAQRDINWARDREALWNAAERAENRSNSRVAREYELALPHEFNRRQRVELVREFSQEIANRYGVAADFALHAPHPKGDNRNCHAHVLTTTRTLEAAGLGGKATIEWSDTNRAKAGMGPAKQEITEVRERWATLINEKLLQLGREERVDHRTLAAQGIDREPTKHLGPAIAGILGRGEHSTVVHRWQQEAGERLRLAKEAGELEREHQQVRESVIDLSNDLAGAVREREREKSQRLTPEQFREKARAEWLEMRNSPDKAKGHAQSHGLDAGEEKNRDKKNDHVHSRDGPDGDFSM
jgi:ATP-dependent exoDNAse (exonuclease V) alpha subunit